MSASQESTAYAETITRLEGEIYNLIRDRQRLIERAQRLEAELADARNRTARMPRRAKR